MSAGAYLSAIIERYFAVRKKCVEAINTGVSGFGTAEELVLLENEGVKFHPDFVYLVFLGTIWRIIHAAIFSD